MPLVLDSGALTFLAGRRRDAATAQVALREMGLWPPSIPSIVLVESLTGEGGRDTSVNRFLKACEVLEAVSVGLARRAARLRSKARRGSAVDAIVAAVAEPDGIVLTQDPDDLAALAAHTLAVEIRTR